MKTIKEYTKDMLKFYKDRWKQHSVKSKIIRVIIIVILTILLVYINTIYLYWLHSIYLYWCRAFITGFIYGTIISTIIKIR